MESIVETPQVKLQKKGRKKIEKTEQEIQQYKKDYYEKNKARFRNKNILNYYEKKYLDLSTEDKRSDMVFRVMQKFSKEPEMRDQILHKLKKIDQQIISRVQEQEVSALKEKLGSAKNQ